MSQVHVDASELFPARDYEGPQNVLDVTFEWRPDGRVACAMPFFGFIAYGADEQAALERVLQMVAMIVRLRVTHYGFRSEETFDDLRASMPQAWLDLCARLEAGPCACGASESGCACGAH